MKKTMENPGVVFDHSKPDLFGQCGVPEKRFSKMVEQAHKTIKERVKTLDPNSQFRAAHLVEISCEVGENPVEIALLYAFLWDFMAKAKTTETLYASSMKTKGNA